MTPGLDLAIMLWYHAPKYQKENEQIHLYQLGTLVSFLTMARHWKHMLTTL